MTSWDASIGKLQTIGTTVLILGSQQNVRVRAWLAPELRFSSARDEMRNDVTDASRDIIACPLLQNSERSPLHNNWFVRDYSHCRYINLTVIAQPDHFEGTQQCLNGSLSLASPSGGTQNPRTPHQARQPSWSSLNKGENLERSSTV